MTLRLNWVALVKTSPNLIYKWPLTSSQQLRWRWGWCWGWCWCVHADRFCDFICIMNLYFEFVLWWCILSWPHLVMCARWPLLYFYLYLYFVFVFVFSFVLWWCILSWPHLVMCARWPLLYFLIAIHCSLHGNTRFFF